MTHKTHSTHDDPHDVPLPRTLGDLLACLSGVLIAVGFAVWVAVTT
jgi:hypothetical protein